MNKQAFKEPKLTKRQRKALKMYAPGSMVSRVLKTGKSIMVGDTEYCGRPPTYGKVPNSLVELMFKLDKGIPFVRVRNG